MLAHVNFPTFATADPRYDGGLKRTLTATVQFSVQVIMSRMSAH